MAILRSGSTAAGPRLSRRAGLAAAVSAVTALVLAEPDTGAAKSRRRRKQRAFCLNGKTIRARNKKKQQRLKRRGATRGACVACPTGQKTCNGACIASTACCTSADCVSPNVCSGGVCVTPACGTGGNCRVFVTAASYNGAMQGATGADANCQTAATAAGLTGQYKAWVGDSASTPATRFTNTAQAGPYVLVPNTALDGANSPPTVAANFAALTACAGTGNDCLQNPVNRTETGDASGVVTPWTGLFANGTTRPSTCSDWTSQAGGSNFGVFGSNAFTNANWAEQSSIRCFTMNPLYCFEQA